jgi:hypothetical protein
MMMVRGSNVRGLPEVAAAGRQAHPASGTGEAPVLQINPNFLEQFLMDPWPTHK